MENNIANFFWFWGIQKTGTRSRQCRGCGGAVPQDTGVGPERCGGQAGSEVAGRSPCERAEMSVKKVWSGSEWRHNGRQHHGFHSSRCSSIPRFFASARYPYTVIRLTNSTLSIQSSELSSTSCSFLVYPKNAFSSMAYPSHGHHLQSPLFPQSLAIQTFPYTRMIL